jgi:SAM-dependent methyltransferase
MNQFQAYAAYYDLINQRKDYESECLYVKRLLRQSNSEVSNILELGCGTGQHAKLLSKSGFHVTGVDKSKAMLAGGNNSDCFTAIEGDARCVRLNKKFDAVIALFHVFSYMISNDDVQSFLITANKHLKIDGTLMFDYWYLPAVLLQKPSNRILEVENDRLKVFRVSDTTLNAETNSVLVEFKIFVEDKLAGAITPIKERHEMRYFSLPEIENFATLTGFELLQSNEFLSDSRPSSNSWGVCSILRKIKEL